MDFSSSKSLARELVQLRLISKDQANQCLRQLDPDHRTGIDVLQVLLDENLLTPFQVESIKKLDTGLLILGGNKLLYPNAAGSFARVFRGENIETGQMIAVKVLRNRWNNDAETIDLFRREAELGMRLKHANIVPIYDIGHENDNHFFTMEFIQGGNLRDFVQIRKQIEPWETVKYTIDMAKGLEYAWGLGVTHRDLKMTNVLFTMDGVAKLIDFGLATDDELLKKMGDGGIQHALEYSTLEKGTGAPRNDPRSDLFFLGTIMYEMLVGQPPYPRTRSREERKQITRYRNIRPLNSAMPHCPRKVSDIVERLLHINPDERYQSASEVLADLHEARIYLQQEKQKQDAAKGSGDQIPTRTLLCIESRVREQDILREYFTRHGFRVLVMSDVQRAIRRLELDPPQLLLYLVTHSEQAQKLSELADLIKSAESAGTSGLVVLPSPELVQKFSNSDRKLQIRQQPLALRDIRKALTEQVEQG